MNVLEARGVSIAFGGLQVLNGVDIDVAPGEIVGLIGPNGAGKTTLLDCLSGVAPCQGRITLAGHVLCGGVPRFGRLRAALGMSAVSRPLRPDARAALGLARSFQDARLFGSLTVLDTQIIAAECGDRRAAGGVPVRANALPRVLELVAALGLGAYRDKLIRELSTGTRRVVDLGCMILQRPRVVLLDEPSSGIAQREAEALAPLLRRIRDRDGTALVVVEHDMPLLLSLADRVYALDLGRVLTSGTPQQVTSHPQVVASYLGSSQAAIHRSGSVARTG